MKALVTGGTGFVGKYLVEALVQQGHEVRVLARSGSDNADSGNYVEFWQGDVTRPNTLKGLGQNIEIVYHLAAVGHVSAISKKAYENFYAVNVQGTENLLRALAESGIQKFVHFSSTAAMGLIKKDLVDETDPPRPVTPYQKSKLESEKIALSLGEELRIPAVVLRPCMIYGPGGYGEFYKIARLMKKGRFPKVGSGLNLTPLVHVKDVVQAAIKAADKGKAGNVYLIASERSLPLDKLREMIIDAWGIRAPYPYIPTWTMFLAAWMFELVARASNTAPLATRRNIANTVADRQFSIKKANEDFGYRPGISFQNGIAETIKFYKEVDA